MRSSVTSRGRIDDERWEPKKRSSFPEELTYKSSFVPIVPTLLLPWSMRKSLSFLKKNQLCTQAWNNERDGNSNISNRLETTVQQCFWSNLKEIWFLVMNDSDLKKPEAVLAKCFGKLCFWLASWDILSNLWVIKFKSIGRHKNIRSCLRWH